MDAAKKEVKKGKAKNVLSQEEQDAAKRLKKEKDAAKRLKKSIETKDARDYLKQKAPNPLKTSKYQVDKVVSNEQAIRESFNKISNLDDEKSIVAEMHNLVTNHEWGSIEKYLEMAEIPDKLPKSLYKDLATKYLSQEGTLQNFWLNYKNSPRVKAIIKDKQDEIEYLPARKPRGPVFLPSQEGRRNKVEVRKPGEKKVVELDDEENVIENPEPKLKVEKPFGEAKFSLSILPFDNFLKEKKITIINNVTKTFITPVGTEEQKKKLESIIRVKGIKETRTEKGITWYLVDERLDLFLCETNRIWIDGSNSVTAILPNKQNIYFKVGYLMSSSDTIFNQTREQFKLESEYINTLRKTRDREINSILESKISPTIQKFARSVLSRSLSDVAKDVTKYENPEQENGYIYKSVQKMIESSDTSTKKLFENLAKITVFLQDSNSIFVERVRNEFYVAEILVILTDQEKLPEVFDDPNQNIDTVKKFIKRKIDSEVIKFARLLYKTNNPTVNEPTLPSHVFKPPYNVLAWKKPCMNKLENDVKKSDVFYYTEEGQVYCLLISDMYKQIKEGGKDPLNPITGKPINADVLKRFRELYDFKFNREDDTVVETPEPGKPISRIKRLPPTRQEKIAQIAPWLLKTIKNNIKGCENELKGMDLEGMDKGKKCKAFDSDDETIVQEESEEESQEESEEELEEELEEESEEESEEELEEELEEESAKSRDDLFTSSLESEFVPPKLKSELSVFGARTSSEDDSESKTPEADYDSDASSNSPRSLVITDGNICQYCKKKIKKNYLKKCLKTKIRDNQDQDKTIWFCMFECFENYKFPYYKNKNKNKNGRKGGRYDSRDRDRKKK